MHGISAFRHIETRRFYARRRVCAADVKLVYAVFFYKLNESLACQSVSFRFYENVVRNDVKFGYERLASRSCLKRPRSFGNAVLFDIYDKQTAVFCNFYRLINVADYISIILRYIVFKSITAKDLLIPHRRIIVFIKIFSKNFQRINSIWVAFGNIPIFS